MLPLTVDNAFGGFLGVSLQTTSRPVHCALSSYASRSAPAGRDSEWGREGWREWHIMRHVGSREVMLPAPSSLLLSCLPFSCILAVYNQITSSALIGTQHDLPRQHRLTSNIFDAYSTAAQRCRSIRIAANCGHRPKARLHIHYREDVEME